MPYTSQTSDFWGWYTRHNDRVVWRHMFDAGIDVFATGPSNNTSAFLDLTNVLPSMSGGFYPRWGLKGVAGVTAPSITGPVTRTFAYNVPQNNGNPTNTTTRNLLIASDDQHFRTVNDDFSNYTGYGPTNLASSGGTVGAVTSRDWFYYGNAKDKARKVNLSYTTTNTDSLNGIDLPRAGGGTYALNYETTDTYLNYPSVWPANTSNLIGATPYQYSTGYGYTSTPTLTITDPVGSGSGAVITLSLGVHGEINGWTLVSPGSNYQAVTARVSAPPVGGVQGYFVVYIQSNMNAANYGEVVGADFAGPISFVKGRQYAVALQNSITGHTSDAYLIDLPYATLSSSLFLNALTGTYTTAETANGAIVPVYLSSQNSTTSHGPGTTQVEMVISVPFSASGAVWDPQVDTVVLMAASDGGGTGTLYQVAVLPLSTFTLASGYYQRYYVDTLPDSYDDITSTGNTLLEADLWAYTDPSGDTFGILLNTPPTATGFLYPTLHQGRMFATDGKTIFFSKSLDEVTTSTGLITSKWEECWPGDYQLPISLNNETIVGLKSDGTNLHVGTDKSIYTVYGSDPSSFSVPAVAFAQTGVMANDLWTVIFVEGQPAGFCWLSPDLKVIYSDFSTYSEIGTQIYPHLKQYNSNFASIMKLTSLTQGPYNFVVLQFGANSPTTSATSPYWFNFVGAPYNSVNPVFWLWETRLKKWYRWLLPAWDVTSNVGGSFVYQAPANSTTWAAGERHLFYWMSNGSTLTARYFDQNAASDAALTVYDTGQTGAFYWNVQSAWQDCGDSTAIKVANEIELTSDNTNTTYSLAPPTVTLWGATSEAQFGNGGVLLKSAQAIPGPIAALNTLKMYCAGTPTAAKYFSVQIGGTYGGHSATDPISPVLSSFTLEQYQMARI